MVKIALNAMNPDQQIQVFEDLKGLLRGYNLESVEQASGVRSQTMYKWLAKNNPTRKPRLDTIGRVAVAIGYELRLIRVGSSNAKKARHLQVVR